MENIWVIISFILVVIGFLGTFLPVLPGLVLCFLGVLAYKFGAGANVSSTYIWVFGLLTALSLLLEYTLPAKINKKYGGSSWGSVGAVLGTFIGIFLIPIPLGFLIGMIGGVLLGEIIHDYRDISKAFRSAKGALIGFFVSTGYNMLVAICIFVWLFIDYFFGT